MRMLNVDDVGELPHNVISLHASLQPFKNTNVFFERNGLWVPPIFIDDLQDHSGNIICRKHTHVKSLGPVAYWQHWLVL